MQKHGVVLEGWTAGSLVRPSMLSNSLEGLHTLLKALKEGTCKFRRLSDEEKRQRRAAYDVGVADGSVVVPTRKTRSDAGKKRKPSPVRLQGEDNEDEAEQDDVLDNLVIGASQARGKRARTSVP